MMAIPTDKSAQDPQAIKSRLLDFMDDQGVFRDHRMTGSNLNAMLDVLAYHTYLTTYGVNKVAGESFMDSATQRNSVVSHAKAMGYTARSRVGARATINVKFNAQEQFINIPRGTRFMGRGPNGTFPFHVVTGQTVTATDTLSGDIEIVQGAWAEETFIKGEADDMLLSNANIDIDTLRVEVEEDGVFTTWTKNNTIKTIQTTDKTYRVYAGRALKYHIAFDDGTLSQRVPLNSRIRVTYLVTEGPKGDGCNVFTAPSIGGEVPTTSIVTTSTGGLEHEDVESIKRNARASRFNGGRAVTSNDYADVARKLFPSIPAITAYGGETAIPPRYGTVFVAADLGDEILSSSVREELVLGLEARSPLITRVEFISAKYVDIDITINPSYDLDSLEVPVTEKADQIRSVVMDYATDNLGGFDVEFIPSVLSDDISEVGTKSVSLDYTLSIKHDLSTSDTLNFGNALTKTVPLTTDTPVDVHRPTILSSSFLYNALLVKIIDDGKGNLFVSSANDNKYSLLANVGTVDYEQGIVTIKEINAGVVDITARTSESVITPAKGYVMRLTSDKVNIT